MAKKRIFLLTLAFLFGTSTSGLADEVVKKINIPPEPTKAEKKAEEGWHFGADIGATVSWNANQNFVGVTDGHYLSFGGKIAGTARYKKGAHEWTNTLSLLETFNKTPIIDALVKASDALHLESEYDYYFGPWYGAFGQLVLDTSVFAGVDQQATDVTYNVTDAGGTPTNLVIGKNLSLTTPFLPLYLQQNLGIFLKPIMQTEMTWEIKGGPSFREVFANGQRIVTGHEGNVVTVKTLSDFQQIGPMLGTSLNGEFFNKHIAYKAGINAMYVAFQFGQPPLSNMFTDNLNVEAVAALSFKYFDWMALTWDFKAIRIPQITREFQIQSNILVTFTYVI